MDINQKRFVEDTLDLLNELDEGLMQLEANPLASAPLEQVFRTLHTIKGAAYMFGFENIGELAHHLETLFDMARGKKQLVSDELISITLQTFDNVRNLLQKKDIRKVTDPETLKGELHKILQFMQKVEKSSGKENFKDLKNGKDAVNTFIIKVTPAIKITADGNHPVLFIVKDIEALGTAKTAPCFGSDTAILHWNMVLSTTTTREEIESYFIFIEHECSVTISLLAKGILWDESTFNEAIDLFFKNQISEEQLKNLCKNLSEANSDVHSDFAEKNERADESKKSVLSNEVIKVSKHKIDDLLNKISELVILKSELINIAQQHSLASLNDIAERMGSVSEQLLNISLEISLVRVETLVTQFKRLVRDLSKALEKKVNFISMGADTEMDKDIIEMMTEPLLHLIRNAVDHGIETPDERKKLGKSEHGTIKLKAFRSNSYINLIISDDGRGIHKEKVIRKAIDLGLLSTDMRPSDEEIFGYIFHQGLTTSNTVSDVSGRGVGMDAVKQKITELRGSITVSSSEGYGTSFHIKLPLSRSIIDGLLVKVSDTRYVIPINEIERIDRIPSTLLDREYHAFQEVVVNGNPLPVFSLRKNFHHHKDSPDTSDIVSVNINGTKKGIAVDRIEGMMQVVLKPLGDVYKHQDFISGSAILGNGEVSLVLDPQRLFISKEIN